MYMKNLKIEGLEPENPEKKINYQICYQINNLLPEIAGNKEMIFSLI